MENLKATKLNLKEWASVAYSNYADQLGANTLEEYIKLQLAHAWEESGSIPALEDIVYGLLELDELFLAKFGDQLNALEEDDVDVNSELTQFVNNLVTGLFRR